MSKKILAKLQNIPEGQPNVNGRVYTKEAIDCMVRSTAEEPAPVRIGQAEPNNPVDVRLTVGRAKVIRKDDGPYIEVTLAGNGAEIVEALTSGRLVAVTDGMGKADYRPGVGTIITDFTLNQISLIPPDKAGLSREEMNARGVDELKEKTQ